VYKRTLFQSTKKRKECIYKIKDIGIREFLQVNHELHKISRTIVEEAQRTDAVIVVGKLKGIRKRIKSGMGRRIEVLRVLWSNPEVHFSGKYFKVN
jgi:transposase